MVFLNYEGGGRIVRKVKWVCGLVLISLVALYFVVVIIAYPLIGVKVSSDGAGRWIVTNLDAAGWGIQRLQIGDEIISIDGVHPSVHSSVQHYKGIKKADTLDVKRYLPSGDVEEVRYVVDDELIASRLVFQLVMPVFTLLLLTSFSVLLYRKKKHDPAAAYLVGYFMLIGLCYLAGFASGRLDPFSRIALIASIGFVPVLFMHFMHIYCRRYGRFFMPVAQLRFAYAANIVIALAVIGSRWFPFLPYFGVRQIVVCALALWHMLIIFHLSRHIRQRPGGLHALSKLMLIAHAIAFTPILTLTILPPLFGQRVLAPTEITALLLLVLPISFMYMFTTRRLFDIDFVLNRLFYHAVLAFLLALPLFGIYYVLAGSDVALGQGVKILLSTYCMVLLFLFCKGWLDRILEPRMIVDMRRWQASLDRIVRQTPEVVKRADLDRLFREAVRDTLAVHDIEIYQWDENAADELTGPEMDGRRESIKRIRSAIARMGQAPDIGGFIPMAASSGLCVVLSKQKWAWTVLWLGEKENKTAFHVHERHWLQSIANYYHLTCENISLVEKLSEQLHSDFSDRRGMIPNWLSRLLYRLTESERHKLAADLHDDALQLVIDLERRLEGIGREFAAVEPLSERLDSIRFGLRDIASSIRHTCFELSPPQLRDVGLNASFETLINNTRRLTGFVITYRSTLIESECDEELIVTLYRIVQELLTNTAKHAQAKTIRIGLEQQGQMLYVTYRDDGIGISDTPVKDVTSHMGLAGIRQRLAGLHGQMDIETSAGKGVNIRITIPLSSAERWKEVKT